MKRIITVLATCVLTLASLNSQAQAYEQGNFIVDVYYGYTGPGLILRSIDLLNEEVNSAGNSFNAKTSVTGPAGLRLQYMISDNFGVGVDASFEQKNASWTGAVFQDYDVNGNPIYGEVEGTYNVTKIKAMVRTSWEFVNTDKFTVNWANSIGYKAGGRTFDDASEETEIDFSGNLFPIAFRSAVGMRFFFTENLGAHVEFGAFGGGMILGGLSLKL